MPKLLLKVYEQELHNRLASLREEIGMNKARDEENNIVFSDSKL